MYEIVIFIAVQATTAYLAFVLNDVVSNSSMQWWSGFVNKWFRQVQINNRYNTRQETKRLWTVFLPELEKLNQNKGKLEKLYGTKNINPRQLSPRYSGSPQLKPMYSGPSQFKNDWSKILQNVSILTKLDIREKKFQGHLDGSSYGLAKPEKVKEYIHNLKNLNQEIFKIVSRPKKDIQLGTSFNKAAQISTKLADLLYEEPYQQKHSFTSTLF